MAADLLDEYRILNTIIEEDKRVSSFKYALLRGSIDISQQYSHMGETINGRAWYPLGLLVEKWILYYYPIFESDSFIPQLNGENDLDLGGKKVSFRMPFFEIIQYYKINGGGFSEFYSDYRKGEIPLELHEPFRELIRKVRWAVIEGPIQHLGHSQYNNYNAVFDWDRKKIHLPKTPISPGYLVLHCGRFSITEGLDLLFKFFGSFILGEGSILNKWADFTAQIGRKQGLLISREQMLNILGVYPNTEREQRGKVMNVYEILLRNQGSIPCVWSGHPLKSPGEVHVDHMLPFSVWKNNDLWNLMPSREDINKQKSDAIPSPDMMIRRQDTICRYWDLLTGTYPDTFQQEIATSLTGKRHCDSEGWMGPAFSSLLEKSRYLIETRGYTARAL